MKREKTNIDEYKPPKPFQKADYIAFAIVTIGEQSTEGEETNSLFNDFLKDALENVALNLAVERVALILKEKAKEQNLNTTRVISPGSGRVNWDLENQKFIFEHLNTQKIGVQLTSSSALQPQKSVSFVMGLGDDLQQAKNLFSCEGCERVDCPYRV